MATKYATLKDSNGDTIYPQISTGSIANGSITSDKIDWSTIVAGATPTSGTISSDSIKTVTVSIPQQANADYIILLTLATAGDYWTRIVLRAHTKTTTSFKVDFANNGSGTAASMWAYYLVVPSAS